MVWGANRVLSVVGSHIQSSAQVCGEHSFTPIAQIKALRLGFTQIHLVSDR